jgi:hypothetical protein
MPAPKLPNTPSLETIRDELVFTQARCLADPDAKDLTADLKKRLAEWHDVHATQLELWDAQAIADARISAADDALDSFIDTFSGAMLAVVGQNRADPRYALYFKAAPSDLKRPVLGAELDTLRGWAAHLAKETDPRLSGLSSQLKKALKAADEAVKARRKADAENEAFRKTGGLATYLADVQKTRDALYVALDARRIERKRARSWPDQAFRKRSAAKPTAAEKATREQRRAAEQARREAIAAAEAQVKAAQKALRDAKKTKKV